MRKTTSRCMRAAINQAPVEMSRGFGRRTGLIGSRCGAIGVPAALRSPGRESSQRQVCSCQCSNVWSMGKGDTPKAVHWEGAQVGAAGAGVRTDCVCQSPPCCWHRAPETLVGNGVRNGACPPGEAPIRFRGARSQSSRRWTRACEGAHELHMPPRALPARLSCPAAVGILDHTILQQNGRCDPTVLLSSVSRAAKPWDPRRGHGSTAAQGQPGLGWPLEAEGAVLWVHVLSR